jgi:hypothetical protein
MKYYLIHKKLQHLQLPYDHGHDKWLYDVDKYTGTFKIKFMSQ